MSKANKTKILSNKYKASLINYFGAFGPHIKLNYTLLLLLFFSFLRIQVRKITKIKFYFNKRAKQI